MQLYKAKFYVEVVPISEGPLSEVPLYNPKQLPKLSYYHIRESYYVCEEGINSCPLSLVWLRAHGELEERRREAEAASTEVLSLQSQLSHSQASVRVTKPRPCHYPVLLIDPWCSIYSN